MWREIYRRRDGPRYALAAISALCSLLVAPSGLAGDPPPAATGASTSALASKSPNELAADRDRLWNTVMSLLDRPSDILTREQVERAFKTKLSHMPDDPYPFSYSATDGWNHTARIIFSLQPPSGWGLSLGWETDFKGLLRFVPRAPPGACA